MKDCQLVHSNFEKSLGSDEAVTGADLEGLVEGISCDDDWSQLVLSHACSTVFGCGLACAPQDVARVLVPGRSGQDASTSGLFPGSRVLLLFVGVLVYRECIAGRVVGFLFLLLEL